MLPLDARRALLSGLPLRAPLQPVASLDDPRPWERACQEGWEGVIAKRRNSPYEHRRSRHWLKMKCEAACCASARTGYARRLSCQVAFIEWTVHGKLRHARLLGIRTDKAAREVVRETG